MACEHCPHCNGEPFIRLGTKSGRMEIALSKDAAFRQPFSRADGTDWDPGTVIQLRFGDTVWTADLDGPDGEFNASASQVNALIAAGVSRGRMFASVAGVPANWFNGEVLISV